MEQEQTSRNSKIADFTRKELIVLCVLTAALLTGVGVKYARDHRWWGDDVELIKGSSKFHYQIDINKADWPELMLLRGIGEAKAKSIVEYRAHNGRFDEIGDLANVDGISEAMAEDIADLITVGSAGVKRKRQGNDGPTE